MDKNQPGNSSALDEQKGGRSSSPSQGNNKNAQKSDGKSSKGKREDKPKECPHPGHAASAENLDIGEKCPYMVAHGHGQNLKGPANPEHERCPYMIAHKDGQNLEGPANPDHEKCPYMIAHKDGQNLEGPANPDHEKCPYMIAHKDGRNLEGPANPEHEKCPYMIGHKNGKNLSGPCDPSHGHCPFVVGHGHVFGHGQQHCGSRRHESPSRFGGPHGFPCGQGPDRHPQPFGFGPPCGHAGFAGPPPQPCGAHYDPRFQGHFHGFGPFPCPPPHAYQNLMALHRAGGMGPFNSGCPFAAGAAFGNAAANMMNNGCNCQSIVQSCNANTCSAKCQRSAASGCGCNSAQNAGSCGCNSAQNAGSCGCNSAQNVGSCGCSAAQNCGSSSRCCSNAQCQAVNSTASGCCGRGACKC